MKIKFETMDNTILEGYEITTIELNKIARNKCKGLTYLMNVMSAEDGNNTVYMWFKDDDTDTSYFVEI